MKQHQLSAAFPSMPEAEIEALAMDIEAHGQREPGVLFEGKVLDGWHRYLACEKVGVQFKSAQFDGADPVAFVISRNLHRRHLTASQRAAAVVACHEWRPNGVRYQGLASSPALVQGMKTTAEMAKEADVGERTIVQAKRAQEAGLGDEVKDGKVSAKSAAGVARLPKAKRAKAVKAIKEGKAPKQKKEKPAPDAKLRAELIDLQGKYADLTEKHADLADTARELQDKLTVFEATEPDEQQKEIMKLQKRILRLEAEVERITHARNDLQNKCNELIRQVKIERKRAG